MSVRIKRVCEPAEDQDGTRVLVDRLWPRGLELAPSTALRKWFSHDPQKWGEFERRYRKELNQQPEQMDALSAKIADVVVTLLYGARDTEHNEAVVLQKMLNSKAD